MKIMKLFTTTRNIQQTQYLDTYNEFIEDVSKCLFQTCFLLLLTKSITNITMIL